MAELLTAAESGDRKATLEALRDHLAAEIEVCESGRDLAALSRQLTLVLDSLAGDGPAVKPAAEGGGSFLDRLAQRDAGGKSGSAAS